MDLLWIVTTAEVTSWAVETMTRPVEEYTSPPVEDMQ
jgi:hypothetical protein